MRAERVVAIHQPNFFPWLGFFDKIARADVFIVLDDAQFPKKGGTWINRVNLRINGEARLATMPVRRPAHGVVPILEMPIDDARPWRADVTKTIAHAYARAPHFDELFPEVERLLAHPTTSVAALNDHAIRALCTLLGIDAGKLVAASTFAVTAAATDRLIELIRRVEGTVYLCGGGAGGYQEDEKFAAAGIELRYQEFKHPEYPQVGGGPFVPGLSILDAMFNLGAAGARALLGAAA